MAVRGPDVRVRGPAPDFTVAGSGGGGMDRSEPAMPNPVRSAIVRPKGTVQPASEVARTPTTVPSSPPPPVTVGHSREPSLWNVRGNKL